MRAAALAVAVVAAFVGVMYLRFSRDSVPGLPPGAAIGGTQCVVFRNVSKGEDASPQSTCGPSFESPAAPVSTVWAGSIAEPTRAAPPDAIDAVQRGSFARVVNTDNTCLNIHSAPRLDAPILDCAAEGVLLRLGIGTAEAPGGVYDVGGVTWFSVITPSGVDGFASGDYLER